MNSMTTKSELRQLVDLISEKVQAIDDLYALRNKSIPCLNDPNAEAFINDPVFDKSAFLAIAAASRLIKSLKNPFLAAQEAASAMYSSALLNVVVEANVTEVLREAGPQGMHVQDLAKKVGIDSGKLGNTFPHHQIDLNLAIAQALRYLCVAEHMYREISPDVFTNNRISSVLDTGLSFESARNRDAHAYHFPQGCAASIGTATDLSLSGSLSLSETLLDPETSFTRDPAKAPFVRSKGFDGTFWEYLDLPDHKHALRRFGAGLKIWDKFAAREEATTAYEWDTLPTSSIVVDVGGGIGGCTSQISGGFPHLRYIIQDRPPVVENGRQVWETTNPDALSSGLVQFQAHNFFEPQPIRGASVYLLRFVLHDWEDLKAQIILENLRVAAGQDSRLVMIEEIVPFACPAGALSTDVKELKIGYDLPSVLYGNPGLAKRTLFDTDISMLNLCNSQERTIGKWKDLLRNSGWDIINVREGYPYSIVCAPI